MVRWVFVLAASLVMSACARNKPSPQPSRTATNAAPVTPPAASPAPGPEQAPPPCADALVKQVAAGAAALGELWTRHCVDVDKTRAILTARTNLSLTGFVTGRRRGTAVAPSAFPNSSTRVSWEGTCVASVDEMLPPSNGLVPTQCLADAEVTEQELPTELNDVRAEFLFNNPAALQRWRSCREQTPAETCLDRLLPSTGGASDRDPAQARWIAARIRARKNVGAVRRAVCRLVLVDRDSRMLGFSCQGTLIDAACRGDGDGVTFPERSLCADGKQAVVARVDPAPPAACLESARTALRVPADRFVLPPLVQMPSQRALQVNGRRAARNLPTSRRSIMGRGK